MHMHLHLHYKEHVKNVHALKVALNLVWLRHVSSKLPLNVITGKTGPY